MGNYDPKNHVIHLQDGSLQDSDLGHIVRNAIEAKAPAGIVIHVHGGRVSQKRGRTIAQGLHGPYTQAEAYPLFFVWETGDLEAPLNNLGEILGEIFRKLLFQKVKEKIEGKVKPALDSVGLKATGHVEIELDEAQLAAELEAELLADPEFKLALDEARADYETAKSTLALKGFAPELTPANAAVVNDRTAAELFGSPAPYKAAALLGYNWATLAWKIAKLAYRVWKRQRTGRGRFGHWGPVVVEEVLRELYLDDVGRIGWWDPMKKDAEDSFAKDTAGGVRFLVELQKQLAGAAAPRITLVGHSAGSIFLCELLDQAARIMPDTTFDLILEAPAVTCERFAEAVTKHRDRIRKFRQLGLKDVDEAREMSLIFPGSLLYLVSNVFENDVDVPLLGMERFFTREDIYRGIPEWKAISACQSFFSEKGPDAVTWWTLDDVGPDEREGWGHGYFDDGKFILKKVTALISDPS